MTQWQILAMHRPVAVQILLYLLGYLFHSDYGVIAVGKNSLRSCLKIGLFGAKGVGKTELVCAISRYSDFKNLLKPNADIQETDTNSSSAIQPTDKSARVGDSDDFSNEKCLKIGGCLLSKKDLEVSILKRSDLYKGAILREDVFVIIEIVPQSLTADWIRNNQSSTDLAILMFSSEHEVLPRGEVLLEASGTPHSITLSSFDVARSIETLLPPELPRIYVASKSDMTRTPYENSGPSNLQCICEYLRREDLPSLISVSSLTKNGIKDLLETSIRTVVNPEIGIPLSERKRRSKFRRLFISPVSSIMSSIVMVGAGMIVVILTRQSWKRFWPFAELFQFKKKE
jgi:hypothetical protein